MAIVLIVSCADTNNDELAKPPNLLDRQQMAEVLSDIQIAEAAIVQKNYGLDSLTRMEAGYYKFIYKKNATTKEVFERSYAYYVTRPDLLDSIYATVIEIISFKESNLRAMPKPYQAPVDSIKLGN